MAPIPRRLRRGDPDDGKAGHPRGGPDGGGVHHLPDLFLPGGAPAPEAARTDDGHRARARPGAGSGPGGNAESRPRGQRPRGPPSPPAPDHGGRSALPGGRQQRGRQAAGADAQVSRREEHGHHRRPGAGRAPGVARRERGGDAGADDGERRERGRHAGPRREPGARGRDRRPARPSVASLRAGKLRNRRQRPRRESHFSAPQGDGRASVGLAHLVGGSNGEVSGAAPDRGRLVRRRLGRSVPPLDEPLARGPRGARAEARPRGRLDRHRERVVPRGAHAEGRRIPARHGGREARGSEGGPEGSARPRRDRRARDAGDRPGQGLGGRAHGVRGAQGVPAAREPQAGRDPQLRGLPDPLVLGRAADALDRRPDPVADELDLQARGQLWRRDHPAHGDLEGAVLSADRQEHAVDEGDAGAPATD